MKYIIEAKTTKGNVRIRNEDALLIKNQILINEQSFSSKGFIDEDIIIGIADGMGGHDDGHIASRVAIEYIKQLKNKKINIQTFFDINERFKELNIGSIAKNAMGTTLSIIKLRNKKLEYFSVGDTSIYLIENNSLTLINELDHLKNKYGKNLSVITNCLGANTSNKALFVHSGIKLLENNSSILICSDGVYNFLDKKDFIKLLTNENITNPVQEILSLALKNGSDDNASAILLRAK